MAKALIVYTTRTGETRKIGELIAEGYNSAYPAMMPMSSMTKI